MRMRIHEAGRKRRIAQIDYLCVARDRQIAPSIDNLIALHDYHGVLHERVRFAVKESRCFQHDWFDRQHAPRSLRHKKITRTGDVIFILLV